MISEEDAFALRDAIRDIRNYAQTRNPTAYKIMCMIFDKFNTILAKYERLEDDHDRF